MSAAVDSLRRNTRRMESYADMAILHVYRARPEPPLPPLGRQALNLSRAALRIADRIITGGPVLVPTDVLATRQACCRACEHFRQSDARCALCGCCTGRPLFDKLLYASEACPAAAPKWHAWLP